jgi:hypothetical protein
MPVWFVDWEDLSSVWSSRDKALNFLQNEAKRLGATLTITDECKYCMMVYIQYPDGTGANIDCCEFNVDELPYEIGD